MTLMQNKDRLEGILRNTRTHSLPGTLQSVEQRRVFLIERSLEIRIEEDSHSLFTVAGFEKKETVRKAKKENQKLHKKRKQRGYSDTKSPRTARAFGNYLGGENTIIVKPTYPAGAGINNTAQLLGTISDSDYKENLEFKRKN